MDPEQIELVRESLRHVLDTSEPEHLPAALIAADWLELLDTEPAIAIGVLAEEQGRSLAPVPTLDLVLLRAAGLPVDATTAFVLPPLRRGALAAGARSASGLRIDGLVLGGHQRAASLVVPTDEGLVAVPASSVQLKAVGGFDPELGLHRATGEVTQTTQLAPPSVWSEAQAAGRRSLSAELIGLADQMLTDSVDYVLARRQFGRAIGSFQAVKHRLADVRVGIGAARAGLAAAWSAGDATSAIAAKCLAARAHRLAATHCHQVQGGIAFTVEHGFHRYIQRGHLLDGLLGAADDLARELGQRLIDTGTVPRVPELTEVPGDADDAVTR
jgi:hypothetical protein